MVTKPVGRRKSPVWLCGGLGALFLAACGHAPEPCPAAEPIEVILRAGDRLNPGETGEALPTTVRLYQLKDIGRLTAATLEQVLDNDRSVLGEDLLWVKEITLYPGEANKTLLDRREGAAVLALVAFFRHATGSGWRAASQLPPPNPFHCHAEDGERRRPLLRFGLNDNHISPGGIR